MKSLNFKVKSWHYKLYESTFDNHPPNNICGYFWMLLLAIVLIPFNIVGLVINFFRKEPLCPAVLFGIIPIICTLIGFLITIVLKTSQEPLIEYYLLSFVLLGFVLIALVLVGLFATLFDFISSKIPRKTKVKKPNPLVEGFKAFKGKYCSKIEWTR